MFYFLIIFYFILVHGQANEDIYDEYKIFKIIPQSDEQLLILEKYLNDPKYDVWSHTRLLNISWEIMVTPFQVKEVENTLKQNKFNFIEINYNSEDYKVFRVTPSSIHQQRVLETVEKSNAFDIWRSSRLIYQPWDIMVSPAMSNNLESLFYMNKMNYQLVVDNVEETINKEVSVDLSRSGRISFTQYNRYTTIQSYLKTLAATYLKSVTLLNIGKTSEGRDILGLKISSGGSNKPAILVDCGIHAREWLAPATCLYIIQELVENSANAAMYKNVDWLIIPSLNADGYEYTFTNDRMWRKTRSSGRFCDGVDGNRNFGFHWNEIGASDYECDETYAGTKAFSEPETQALRDFALANKANIKLYLTFHSYGSMLLYPWGFTSDYPDNANELQSLAEKVDDAIASVRGTRYVIGSSTNVLYPAAGGSDDWMMGVAGVPLAYTIELPSRNGGFQPAASEISGVVKETFQGIKVYQKYIEEQYA